MPALLAGFCDFLRQMLRCPLHVQVILFVDDKTVSKGMVKYATAIPRESMVDVSGEVHVPETPVAGCTCSKASLVHPPVDQARSEFTSHLAEQSHSTEVAVTVPWILRVCSLMPEGGHLN